MIPSVLQSGIRIVSTTKIFRCWGEQIFVLGKFSWLAKIIECTEGKLWTREAQDGELWTLIGEALAPDGGSTGL